MSTDPVPKPPYPKPPIVEAVIHLQVSGNINRDEQNALVRRFSGSYPESEAMAGISVTIDTTGGGATVQQQPNGFRLKTKDQTDVLLVQPNGIAAARLAPYLGWEALRAKGVAAWREWRKSTSFSPLSRLGVRYINRIDIPIGGADRIELDEFLLFKPSVPDSISKAPFIGHLIQATFPMGDTEWTATLTSNLAIPPPLIDHFSILLDIDVFRTTNIPGQEEALWKVIDEARDLKNKIFESCVTDEARKLFA